MKQPFSFIAESLLRARRGVATTPPPVFGARMAKNAPAGLLFAAVAKVFDGAGKILTQNGLEVRHV